MAQWLTGVALLLSIGCGPAHRVVESAGRKAHTVEIAFNNVHLLVVKDGVLVVDSGLAADAPELMNELAAHGIAPNQIKAIVLSHGHADHAGGADYLRQKTGAPVIAGDGDKSMIAIGKNDRLCPTDLIARDERRKHQSATYMGFKADTWVSSTMSLKPSTGIDAEVVALPGHTRGSLIVVADDWAFVGDLFRGSIVGGGAETHFYMCDLDDNLRDIEWLLKAYPKVQTYFTGHFGPVDRQDVIDLVEDRRADVPAY